jgi:dynein light intermediate chain 1
VIDGAALFYTTPIPATLQVLRQYALHSLFMPPAPSPSMATSSEVQAPVRKVFPFTHKPNTLDRDRIVVPAGWDSWGKISVLRDGFDAKMWGEAWERDLAGEEGQASGETSAKKAYANLVPDQGPKVITLITCQLDSNYGFSLFSQPHPLPPFNNPTPEQAFLAKNYDENSKKTDRDPRGAFRNPQDFAGASAGIVGPLGSSSFSLPNVERALSEMESGVVSSGGAAGVGGATRLGAGRPAGTAGLGRPSSLSTSLSPVTPTTSRSPASPSNNPGQSPGGQSQHEVLQNFFQSLLSTKDRGANASRKTNGTAEDGS